LPHHLKFVTSIKKKIKSIKTKSDGLEYYIDKKKQNINYRD